MPTRLRQLPTPTDSEAVRLQKLASALIPALDPDVQRDVTPLAGDTAAVAAGKLQRATVEAVAKIVETSTRSRRVFEFTSPAASFNIPHNLGVLRPNVVVTNSAGRRVYGGIQYVDANNLTLDFGAAFSCVVEVSI